MTPKQTRAPGGGRKPAGGPPKVTVPVYLLKEVKERLLDRARLEGRSLSELCAEHLTALVSDIEGEGGVEEDERRIAYETELLAKTPIDQRKDYR